MVFYKQSKILIDFSIYVLDKQKALVTQGRDVCK